MGLWEKYTLNLHRDDTYHTDRETGRVALGWQARQREAKQGGHASKAASLFLNPKHTYRVVPGLELK
jgi:hypothetical protein